MRKYFARCLSVVLALVMVLSMSASAQSTRMTANVETPYGNFDASLTSGFDADGCEQFILESAALGKLLLQSDGNYLTVGSDADGYITISSEELRKALTAILYSATSNLPVQNIFDIVNYLTGPQYGQDMQTIMNTLSQEANRFASVAMNLGLVTISDNGDLTIKATFEQLVKLLAGYLKALSQDAAAINNVLALGIFEIMGVDFTPVQDQIPAALYAAGEELESGAAYVQDGGLNIFISASGTMDAEVYVEQNGATVKFVLKADANGATASASIVEGANMAAIVYTVNNNGTSLTVDYNAQGYIVDADLICDANGLNASIIAKDNYGMDISGKLTMNANGLNAEGKMAVDGDTAKGKAVINSEKAEIEFEAKGRSTTVSLDVDFDFVNGEYEFDYQLKGGYVTEKVVFELEDGELYYVHNVTEGGRTVKDVMITGSNTYRVNATFEDSLYTYKLEGTVRNKDGFTFEGEFTANSKSASKYAANFAAELEATISENGLEAEFAGEIDSYYDDTAVEGTLTANANGLVIDAVISAGGIESLAINISVANGVCAIELKNEYACIVAKLGKSGNGVAGEVEVIDNENSDNYLKGTFSLNDQGLTVNGVYKDRYNSYAVNAVVNSEKIEGTFSDGSVEYRVYFVDSFVNGIFTAEAGLTGAMLSNPANVMEAVKVLANINLNNLVHNVSISAPAMGALIESSFDGSVYKYVCDVNGERTEATAKLVEENGNTYIQIDAVLEGVPGVIRIGVKQTAQNAKTLYAEAEVQGQLVGAAINAVSTSTSSSTSTRYELVVYQNGETQTLGAATMTYEVLPGNLEHVTGTEITAEELVQAFSALMENLMYMMY